MAEPTRKDEIQGEIIHVYDGIEEADNLLPRWWLVSFYVAIAFGLVYWFAYHEYGWDELPPDVYATAMAEREAAGPAADEAGLLALLEDGAAVSEGQNLFLTNCVACHGDQAQGQIGPNLTDNAWLHGGEPMDIYTTIKDGAPNGMVAWGSALGEGPVQRLTAFVLSIRDTNVAGRDPEGEVMGAEVDDDAGAEETATEELDAGPSVDGGLAGAEEGTDPSENSEATAVETAPSPAPAATPEPTATPEPWAAPEPRAAPAPEQPASQAPAAESAD